MESKEVSQDKQKSQIRLQVICFVILLVCLIMALLSIGKRFVGLNDSVEYERVVFISQIAKQIKENMVKSRNNHLELTRNMVNMLDEVSPQSFKEVRRMIPEYTGEEAVNQFFFLSSDCELFGVDGIKQWASLPYEEYILDAVLKEYTTDFIRIGMKQEFMVFSSRLSAPIMIDGHEIVAIMYGWDSSEYRTALSSSLFEEKSSSLLVGIDGNIVIYPENKDSESYGYNIFTYLEKQGMSSRELEIVKNMVVNTKDNTLLCDVKGSRWLFSVSQYSDTYYILVLLPIEMTSSGTYDNLYGLIISVGMTLLILFLFVGGVFLSIFWRRKEQRVKELQTELLMKTAQAKNDFLAKMSHDIRTPLNGIIGMNYIASTKIPPENIEIAECLQKVDVSAKYLLGILNNILDMSKIESGKMEIRQVEFSMDELLGSINSIVEIQAKEKGVSFVLSANNSLSSFYIGDGLRINQILMNLVSNALKFTDKGGHIDVNVEPIEKNGEKETIRFTVSDNGIGMTEAFMQHIFDPFTQDGSEIANQYGGSGLGLSIVKNLVGQMNGRVGVVSKKDVGSTFTVELPLKAAQRADNAAAQAAEQPDESRLAGMRILLAEDNELNRVIAREILQMFNVEVDEAVDGKNALEDFVSKPAGYYTAIITDIRMPVMDGYEMSDRIRHSDHPDAQSIPIFAMSANAFDDDVAAARSYGMNAYLKKPIDVDELKATLCACPRVSSKEDEI